MIRPGPEHGALPVPPPLDLPPHWWGPFGRRADPLTIQHLIATETIDRTLAACLWLLIEQGASVLICAGPGGAGKTTLLTALTAFLPPERTPYAVRGAYDRLDSISHQPPAKTALLINELSAHLPIYTWGPGARRVFDAGHAGAQLLATAHATNDVELREELAGPPILAAHSDLRLWDLVIFINAWQSEHGVIRQVGDVVSFSTEWPVLRMVDRSLDGTMLPVDSSMLLLARRFGYSSGTIEEAFVRRFRALEPVP